MEPIRLMKLIIITALFLFSFSPCSAYSSKNSHYSLNRLSDLEFLIKWNREFQMLYNQSSLYMPSLLKSFETYDKNEFKQRLNSLEGNEALSANEKKMYVALKDLYENPDKYLVSGGIYNLLTQVVEQAKEAKKAGHLNEGQLKLTEEYLDVLLVVHPTLIKIQEYKKAINEIKSLVKEELKETVLAKLPDALDHDVALEKRILAITKTEKMLNPEVILTSDDWVVKYDKLKNPISRSRLAAITYQLANEDLCIVDWHSYIEIYNSSTKVFERLKIEKGWDSTAKINCILKR